MAEIVHNDEEDSRIVHVVLLSFPVPSHLNPLLQLARKLFSSSPSSCTFLFTSIVSLHTASRSNSPQNNHSHGDHHDLSQDPQKDRLNLSYGDHNGQLLPKRQFTVRTIALPDGLPFHHPRSDLFSQLQASQGMKSPVEQLLLQLQRTHQPVNCIISDVFVTWSHDVASKLNIPFFAFFTSNATACCVMSHARELLCQGIIPFKANVDSKTRITCPGAPALLPREFPPSMQAQDMTSWHAQMTLKMFEHLEKAAGLIMNTFYELESKAVEVLRARCPVFTVGPLLLPRGEESSVSIEQEVSFWKVEDRCINWLDNQASASVLYVAFGSLSTFSDREQMEELALGLEASHQPFLWVIRQDAVDGSLSEFLPEGFLDRNKDRSLIISWAPQLHVLKHPAVGGFLSHCGWNSMLENVALGGIPMLCWPAIAEQKVNARVLVDDWKLALEFQRRDDGKVDRVEVERVVKALMQGEQGNEIRKRGAELNNLARKAVKRGGSSFENMEALVKKLRDVGQIATAC